ncbi:hypothetical protein Hypma_016351 [Hypsizygus marmoreus]|uniref:Fungal-type protein kinase domain-containing protein n=1 Tax=Hypsizygus marmoreus TaxID=39966 RepID=A0A369IYR5_HYPMA|nr:hypothetical protein Hypma_016351 [Hypsizygus marmoreus]
MNSILSGIAGDIQQHDSCDFRTILSHFLWRGRNPGPDDAYDSAQLLQRCLDVVLPICNSPEILRVAREYCKTPATEPHRHSKLVEWFNMLLEELEKLEEGEADAGSVSPFHFLGGREASSRRVRFQCKATHTDSYTPAFDPDPSIVLSPAPRAPEGQPADASLDREQQCHWGEYLSVVTCEFVEEELQAPPEHYDTTLKHFIPCESDVRKVPSQRPKPEPVETPSPPKPKYLMRPSEMARLGLDCDETEDDDETEEDDEIEDDDETEVACRFGNCSCPPTPEPPEFNGLPPLIQNARYGADLLCRGMYTTHAITLLVVDDAVWVWWFDRQGAIQSTGINFAHDLPYFVVLLVAFQRFDLADWGVIEGFQSDPYDLKSNTTLQFRFPDSDVLTVIHPLKPVHCYFELTDRARRILGATEAYSSEKTLVFKSYWGEESRSSEAEIIKAAEDLHNEYVTGHIPQLIAHYEFGYLTTTIRCALGMQSNTTASHGIPRVLRVLLFKALLPIVRWSKSASRFLTLEPSTLMRLWVEWYRRVLNDFDLATLRNPGTGANLQHCGTVQFMAIDLLRSGNKIRHLYRHDLESFIWVLIWVVFNGTERYHQDVNEHWSNAGRSSVYKLDTLWMVRQLTVEDGMDRQQFDLAYELIFWLANAHIITRPRNSLERLDEDIFREFEDIVASKWAWDPPFVPMASSLPA